jgi:hypothetical protein
MCVNMTYFLKVGCAAHEDCKHKILTLTNDSNCQSQCPCGLRRGSWPVDCWDRGFKSRSRHECLSASFCVVLSCVGRGLTTG